ncbi:MAG: hypothetical protein RSE91_04710 [Bacilli bacterium]
MEYTILGIVLMIIIFGKNMKFSDVEEKMKSAAVQYYTVHNYLLPVKIGDSETVEASSLVKAKFMKPFTSYNSKAKACSGKVTVKKVSDSSYTYVSELDCGKLYTSIPFYKQLIDKGTVTTGDGLYHIGNEYIYRGDNPNNYVTFGGNNFRIVKATKDNYLMLVLNHSLENTYNWDNRYNVDTNETDGINSYSLSRVKDSLNYLYKGTSVVNKAAKDKLVPQELCIGKRSVLDEGNSNIVECSVKDAPEYFGLLTVSDFLMGSVDQNCKKALDYSCLNYNYLNQFSKDYWLLTASATNSSLAYKVVSYSNIYQETTNRSLSLRPTVYLNENIKLNGGNGTYTNPYLLK